MLDLAFIGLGVMGGPMAGHLAKAGHRVTVYNRTAKRAEAWVAANGGIAKLTPREAAQGADIVFACVGNDDDLRHVTTGRDGAFAGMKSGAIFVDHTTASAEVARELHAEAAKAGVAFLDAPVSGGPAIRHFGRAVTLMGPSGAGQLTKMVNQICIAGLVQGLSEGIAFAEHAGLDVSKVVDVISKGAAQSWQMENRSATMIENRFDFGFAVDWMRKDLSIVLDEARRNGARVPVAALVDQFYATIQGRGGNRWDTSSLVTLLRDR
jgi:3-hydroxyisobutyrate dehydrogenase-like beta-hydroxyacid dehydrogenase